MLLANELSLAILSKTLADTDMLLRLETANNTSLNQACRSISLKRQFVRMDTNLCPSTPIWPKAKQHIAFER